MSGAKFRRDQGRGPWPRLQRPVVSTSAGRLASGVIVVAVFGCAGEGASDTEPNTVSSSGSMSLINSREDSAILRASGMAPGDVRSGEVDIRNSGQTSGSFRLSRTGLEDVPSSPALSSRLKLTVHDFGRPDCHRRCRSAVTVLAGARMNTWEPVKLGRFDPGEARRYRFVVTFTEGSPAQDNRYQNAATQVQFNWTATEA